MKKHAAQPPETPPPYHMSYRFGNITASGNSRMHIGPTFLNGVLVQPSSQNSAPPANLAPPLSGTLVKFDYDEFDWDGKEPLGEGAFASVYKLKKHEGAPSVCAIKQFKQSVEAQAIVDEALLLEKAQHPHIVALYGLVRASNSEIPLGLVMECMLGGNLYNKLHSTTVKFNESWASRLTMAYQIAQAVEYLHSLEIIHRDIKSPNVLIDGAGVLKLADFGISRVTDATTTAIMGTPLWAAPEFETGETHSYSSDLYALGIVMLELVSGDKVLTLRAILKAIDNQQAGEAMFPEQCPAGLKKLITTAWDSEPANRLDAVYFKTELKALCEEGNSSSSSTSGLKTGGLYV